MAEKKVKFPNGTAGIVLAATNESKQEDLFFPSDNRLIAVNVNGDVECGSLVYDLNSQSEMDRDRGARLQSAFRVIKQPMGLDNAIGFQVGPSGQQDTGGGWFVDIPDGLCADGQIAVAQGSWLSNGPLHPGHLTDKHKMGVDADGNIINPLHLYMRTNFYLSRDEDGPLEVENYKSPERDKDHIIPVHFGFDHGSETWKWWTTCAMYQPPGQATVDPGIPKPIPGSPPFTLAPFFDMPYITSDSRTGPALRLLASLQFLTAPGNIVRPQNYSANVLDTGVYSPPNDKAKKKADKSSPVTIVASGFAAQGGTIAANGSVPASNVGPEGDPWVYTSVPSGTTSTKPVSKFPGGTASGGICYHPPETDLRDIANGLVPPNTTLSTVYVITGPGAYFGAGVPELVNGGIKNGWVWGFNSSTSDLDWKTVSASGTPRTGLTFAQSTERYQWYDGTSFYGEFAHANTASRTYTFQNASGTVAFTSDIPAAALNAYKSADESVLNSTTLQDDNHLTVTVASSTHYSFRFKIWNTTASVTAGIKLALNGTCTLVGMMAQIYIYDDTTNTLAGFARVTSLGSSVGAGLGAGDNYAVIEGTAEISNGGTFLLQWAQNTADAANATTVQRGSVMEVYQVP